MGVAKAEEHPYTQPARIVKGTLTYEVEGKENQDRLILSAKKLNT